jgi:hypothetical protein
MGRRGKIGHLAVVQAEARRGLRMGKKRAWQTMELVGKGPGCGRWHCSFFWEPLSVREPPSL